MDLPEANSIPCVICTVSVSSLPLSVMVCSCHACVNFSHHFSRASFTPMLCSGSSPSLTRQQTGHIACTKLYLKTCGLHEIFKCTHFCGIWPQTDIYTHNFRKCSHASVGRAWVALMWGSLRLAPTTQMIYHRGGEPERAMHCWLNVMAHKPWITAEFVTVCCSVRHEHGKQYFMQPFLRSMKLLRVHTCFS